EGLSILINKAVARGDIHEANISEANRIMEILKLYAEASMQEINMNKSEVFFSRNISRPA
ncbi:RNA-directed DNA polymerase (Reverse transcriptase), partial [Trifolium medium]|nr:RNA-directed DNA polymerase (Reverse transcriptase) [Trifolium medium]